MTNDKYKFSGKTHRHSLSFISKEITPQKKYNFKDVAMTHSKFYNCTIKNVDFSKAAVTGSLFEKCEFIDCNFDEADFEFCDFRNCKISTREINNCSFNNSNCIETTFSNIHFDSCTLTGTYFDHAHITNVDITFSTLEGACFSKCNFKDLDWRNLNLEYVEFIEPHMDNVVLPFYQIPYMFGVLQYLVQTTETVTISNDTSTISVDEYFKYGIPFLLKRYEEGRICFPMSNIYLFGRDTDYNRAFEYLSEEVNTLSMRRDFRGIKFCCKLISMSQRFSKKHLNQIYKNITNVDISIDPNSAEMKSFTRNIGEIRSILYRREKTPSLLIRIQTNIEIEYSMRFANLMKQFQNIAKPNHTDKVHTTFMLSQNSPLLIDIKISGDINLFLPILYSFLILTGIAPRNCLTYPLVKSLETLQSDSKDKLITNNVSECAQQYRNELVQNGIELTLLEYYAQDCESYLNINEKEYYIDDSLLMLPERRY